MRLSPAGRNFLIRWEGVRLARYRDSAGRWTIGVGHLLSEGEDFEVITRERAMGLLDADLAVAEAAVSRLVSVPINQNQADALISFAFNLGATKLKYSTLLAQLNAGRFGYAADEFLRWCKARDRKGDLVTVEGLLNRRRAERELFTKPMEG